MNQPKEFPFERARRVTRAEVAAARAAIEALTGEKRSVRPRTLRGTEKPVVVSLRLPQKVMTWARREAKRRGVRYQAVIFDALWKAAT